MGRPRYTSTAEQNVWMENRICELEQEKEDLKNEIQRLKLDRVTDGEALDAAELYRKDLRAENQRLRGAIKGAPCEKCFHGYRSAECLDFARKCWKRDALEGK